MSNTPESNNLPAVGTVREDGYRCSGYYTVKSGEVRPKWQSPEAMENQRIAARKWYVKHRRSVKKSVSAGATEPKPKTPRKPRKPRNVDTQCEIEFVTRPATDLQKAFADERQSWADVLKELESALQPKRSRDTKAELRELYDQLSLRRRVVAAFKMVFKIA